MMHGYTIVWLALSFGTALGLNSTALYSNTTSTAHSRSSSYSWTTTESELRSSLIGHLSTEPTATQSSATNLGSSQSFSSRQVANGKTLEASTAFYASTSVSSNFESHAEVNANSSASPLAVITTSHTHSISNATSMIIGSTLVAASRYPASSSGPYSKVISSNATTIVTRSTLIAASGYTPYSSGHYQIAPNATRSVWLGGNGTNGGSTFVHPTGIFPSGFVPSRSLSLNSTNGTATNANSWEAALSCNAAWQSWSSAAITSVTLPNVSTTISYSGTYRDFVTPENAIPYTTLCDGTPRAHGEGSYSIFTNYGSYSMPSVTTQTLPHITAPPCSIPVAECEKLWASYYFGDDGVYQRPACPSTCVAKYRTSWLGSSLPPCYIQANEVEVAYWPVQVEGDLCGAKTTIAPNNSIITTASTWGTTVTSPGVLVSFRNIWAIDQCSSTIGEVLTGYILAQQTSQISSQCGAYHQGGSPGTQVNFADFNFPYPASAYKCQPQCGNGVGGMENFCMTMYDNFNPQIAFPTDVFEIRPEWKDCKVSMLGNVINDPPKALTQMPAPAEPTTPTAGPGPTTPASPQQTPPQTTPKPTGGADPVPTPPSDPEGGDDPGEEGSGGDDGEGGESDHEGVGSGGDGGSNGSGGGGGASGNEGGSGGDGGNNSGSGSNNGGSEGDDDGNSGGGGGPDGENNNGSNGSDSNGSGPNGSGSNGSGPNGSGSNGSSPHGSGSNGSNGSGSNGSGSDSTGSGDGSPSHGGSGEGASEDGQNGNGSHNGAGSGVPNSGGGADSNGGSNGGVQPTQDIGGVIASILQPTTRQSANSPEQTTHAGSGSPGANNGQSGGTGVLQLGDKQVTAVAAGTAGAIKVAGQTLSAGQVATIEGHIVSNAGNNIVVDGSTTAPVSRTTAAPGQSVAIVAGPSGTLTVHASDGTVVVGGQTLTPGQVKVIDGQTISDASTALVVDEKTVAFSVADQSAGLLTEGAVFKAGSATLTAIESAGTATIDGRSLTSGQVITMNGHTISDAGTALIIDGQRTIPFSRFSAQSTPSVGAIFTISGHIYTATDLPNGDIVVDGTTLHQGGAATTINGLRVSDGADGLVVGGRTLPASTLLVPHSTPPVGAVFTISGHVYTATDLPNGDIVVDGTTLHEDGAAITIDGVHVSDGPHGLVVGSRTLAVSTLIPDATGVTQEAGHSDNANGADLISVRQFRVLGLCAVITGLVLL